MSEEKYPRGVEVVVGAFIVDNKGKILLFTSPKWNGEYVVPGGHVEAGEKLENAIKREVKEEIGVEIEVITQFELAEDFVCPPEFKRNAHFIYINYIVKLKSDKFVFNEELTSCKWFSFDEVLNSNKFRKGYKESIKKIKNFLKI